MNQNLTITNPLHVDTVERLENIHALANFLFQHGFQNTRVIEGTQLSNGFVEELLAKRINCTYIK